MIGPTHHHAADAFYLIRSDMLSDAMHKTLQVKNWLADGTVQSVQDGTERAKLSRSAFYKYKDAVHELGDWNQKSIVTVSLNLSHQAGVLSRVLSLLAAHGGNVLTINQTIPLQDTAHLVMSIETSAISVTESIWIADLQRLDGVRQTKIIGRGQGQGQR